MYSIYAGHGKKVHGQRIKVVAFAKSGWSGIRVRRCVCPSVRDRRFWYHTSREYVLSACRNRLFFISEKYTAALNTVCGSRDQTTPFVRTISGGCDSWYHFSHGTNATGPIGRIRCCSRCRNCRPNNGLANWNFREASARSFETFAAIAQNRLRTAGSVINALTNISMRPAQYSTIERTQTSRRSLGNGSTKGLLKPLAK